MQIILHWSCQTVLSNEDSKSFSTWIRTPNLPNAILTASPPQFDTCHFVHTTVITQRFPAYSKSLMTIQSVLILLFSITTRSHIYFFLISYLIFEMFILKHIARFTTCFSVSHSTSCAVNLKITKCNILHVYDLLNIKY